MSWRSDLIASMTREEAATVLGLITGAHPEAFDYALGAVGGSLRERFEQAEVRECRHCNGPIRRCLHIGMNTPDYPLCLGWHHVGYDDQPVIGHCCGGRSINPPGEPREDAEDGEG